MDRSPTAQPPGPPAEPSANAAEAPHLRKVLTWVDGFAFSLLVPTGLFVTFGYLIGAIGVWTAIALWCGAAVIAFFQNFLFAEMATMFPSKSGGLSRYAAEAWKRYFAPLGAVAAFGYWMGWSMGISVTAGALGALVQAQWFPDETWGVHFMGHVLGLATLVGIASILGAWAANYFGVRIGASINKVIGLAMLVCLIVAAIGPMLRGNWDIHNLTWRVSGGWMTIVVMFYVTSWVVYGTELCATFAPEYKDTVRDTPKALRYAGLLMIAVFFIVPFGVGGAVGEPAIAANPVGYVALAFQSALGTRPATWPSPSYAHP